MKPVHLKVPAFSTFYIDARREQGSCFANPWHFHEELELTYVIKSEGTKFIGDHISEFKPGEIVLLGSRLPHYWRNHSNYYQAPVANGAEAIIIRFNRDFAGKEFLTIPPMKPIFDLLNTAKRGISICEQHADLQQQLNDFLTFGEAQRIIALTEILLTIATQKPYQYLCSIGYAHHYKSYCIDRYRCKMRHKCQPQ